MLMGDFTGFDISLDIQELAIHKSRDTLGMTHHNASNV